VDREEIDFHKDIFPDKATARKIHSLVIKCSSAGCEWTGELREKEGHLLTCSFKLISCMNANCEVTTTRKDLDEHMNSVCQWRIVSCEHCSEPHPFCQLQDHADNCKKKPVECPNGCGELIVAEEITSHVNDECPLTEISCPYAQMGCNTKIQRKEVESHLQSTTTLHLDLTCATLKKTTERLEQTAMQVQELKAANSTLSSKVYAQDIEISKLRREYTTFVWKVDGFNKVLEDAKIGISECVQSVPFYTGKQGYKLRVRIYPDGGQSNRNRYLSVFLVLMEGKFDGTLPWPFHQKVTFTLIDQQDDPACRSNWVTSFNIDSSWSFSQRPSVGENEEKRGRLRFVSHRNLQTRRYIDEDAIFLQVNIDPPDPSTNYEADVK